MVKQIYFATGKSVIRPAETRHETFCHCCHQPLDSGLGDVAFDKEGTERLLGPDCFSRETGVKKPQLVKLGSNKRTDHLGDADTQMAIVHRHAADPELKRRLYAQANVMLRADILPGKGFKRTFPHLFKEFMGRVDQLTKLDVDEIESRIHKITMRDQRQTLEQLQCANLVNAQMDRMLNSRRPFPALDNALRRRVKNLQNELHLYNGLIDLEMKNLCAIAAVMARPTYVRGQKRVGVINAVNDLFFPANQQVFENYRGVQRAASAFAETAPATAAGPAAAPRKKTHAAAPAGLQMPLFV